MARDLRGTVSEDQFNSDTVDEPEAAPVDKDSVAIRRYEEFAEKDNYRDWIVEAGERYLECEELVPGDVVYWKKALKSHRIPSYGRPMFFLRYLNVDSEFTLPFMDDQRLRTALVGFLDGDGDFVTFRADPNRLSKSN